MPTTPEAVIPPTEEHEEVVPTETHVEDAAPDPLAAEREAIRAELNAENEEKARVADAKKAADTLAAKRQGELDAAKSRAENWLKDPLAESWKAGRELTDGYGNRIVSDEVIQAIVSPIVARNLNLVKDIQAWHNAPIEHAAQDLITDAVGEDGWKAFQEATAENMPAKAYYQLLADTLAPKSAALKEIPLESFLKTNPKAEAAHKRAIADAEKRGRDLGRDDSAGGGGVGGVASAGASGGGPTSLKEAQDWHADPNKPQYDNTWMRNYKRIHGIK